LKILARDCGPVKKCKSVKRRELSSQLLQPARRSAHGTSRTPSP
jgi:hypothetical protein